MKKLLIKWNIIPCEKRVLHKIIVFYFSNGNIMNKKLALQKLSQILDSEEDKNKRRFIATISLWLKLDEPFSLVLAIAVINEYNL